MKIGLISSLRSHHFDFAKYLLKENTVNIFTASPKWKLKNEIIPNNIIKTFPWLMVPKVGMLKLGLEVMVVERFLNWNGQKLLDLYAKNILKKNNFDIVESFSCYGYESGKSLQAKGGKYIIHRGSAHSIYQEEILSEEAKIWSSPFIATDPKIIKKELLEFETADLINAPSEYVKKTFIQQGFDESKISVIPYGVNLSHFKPIYKPDNKKFTVLYVGRVSIGKGIPYLIDAFKRLEHPNKEIILAGGVYQDIKPYLDKNLDNIANIKFLGSMNRLELNKIMSKSHVMVLPSLTDGFGKVITEAMACGCPVICTENTGGYGYLENGIDGFVVPIRSSNSILENLQKLADNPDYRNKVAMAAKAKVDLNFGWENYANKFLNMCQNLLNKA